MATALDSAYEWGIDPQNQSNLSPAQVLGLGSLAPQSGIGLLGQPARTALSPYAKLPTPAFAPGAAVDFSFEVPALETVAQKAANGTGPANANSFETAYADVGNPANQGADASNRPYFDPNYPYESMLALKNWLTPQIDAGVAPAENARGLDYSGIGAYGKADAENYLSQLTPVGETGAQALGNDFDRLYGPNITNSLIKGTASRPGDTIGSIPIALPGATPFGDGDTNAQAALVANPNYVALPSGPPMQPPANLVPGTAAYYQWLINQYPGLNVPGYNPGTGTLTPLPPGTYGVESVEGSGALPTAAGGSTPPWEQPYQPQYGLYDLASNTEYATPGYFYNPNQAPDAARMPWLANATPYSGS